MVNTLLLRSLYRGRKRLSILCDVNSRLFSTVSPLDRFRMKPAIEKNETVEDPFEGIPEKDVSFDDKTEFLPSYKLGKHLLKLGKVHYRHIESMPEWMQAKQAEICSFRTTAQIRRCLQNWMIKYDRELQRSYRDKNLGWRNTTEEIQPNKIVYGPEETIAYAQYFMPSRFAITKRIFSEMKELSPFFHPKRVLDFGSGPGTNLAAAVSVWGDSEHKDKLGVQKYTAIDMSQSMLDAAKIMAKDVKADCVFWSKTSEVVQLARSRGDRFDLIVCSYTLNELPSDPSRKAAVQLLYELLDVGGQLVFLEQGNPQGSHAVRTARQFLLSSFNADEKSKKAKSKVSSKSTESSKFSEGIQYALPSPKPEFSNEDFGVGVISPCTHDKPCPLGPGVWCSFSQKVHSGMIRVGSEEKFSYVVMQRKIRQNAMKTHADSINKDEVLLSQLGSWLEAIDGTSAPDAERAAKLSEKLHYDPSPLDIMKRFMDTRYEIEKSFSSTDKSRSSRGGSILVDVDDINPEEIDEDLDMELGNVDDDGDEEDFDEDDEDFDESSVRHLPGNQIQQLVNDLNHEVDWNNYRPNLRREEWGRVLRSPIKGKGHITLDLCYPSGNITRHVLSKGGIDHVPALYTALRKTTWGGLFPAFPQVSGADREVIQEERSPLQSTGLKNSQHKHQHQPHHQPPQQMVRQTKHYGVPGSVGASGLSHPTPSYVRKWSKVEEEKSSKSLLSASKSLIPNIYAKDRSRTGAMSRKPSASAAAAPESVVVRRGKVKPVR